MMEKQSLEEKLLEALKHILHTVDWDPNASDREIIGAINWTYLRNTVEQAENQMEASWKQ